MKSNEATIFIFIASIIIGLLISLNINFGRPTGRNILSAAQYQEALNNRNRLYRDINNIEEQYNEYYSKLQKYKYGDKNATEHQNEIKSELLKSKTLLGTEAVEGEGIEIILKDASNGYVNNELDASVQLVHNGDIIQIINDLKNAGAEAISLNDQRVIDRTEIDCSGPFIRVNGIKITTPFYIYAIGNKDALKDYMWLNENYLKVLTRPDRQIRVELLQLDKVKIPAYIYTINNEYLTSQEKK